MHFTTEPVRPPVAGDARQDCALYARLDLDADVFVDASELDHQHWLDGAFAFDLELPRVAVDPHGSTLLLNLTDHGRSEPLSIPLHARYPLAKHGASGTTHRVHVPQPTFVWSCPTPRTGGKHQNLCQHLLSNCFAEIAPVLSSISPFPSDAILLAAKPESLLQERWVDIPAGDLRHGPFVDVGTKAVVLLMALYLTVELLLLTRVLHTKQKTA